MKNIILGFSLFFAAQTSFATTTLTCTEKIASHVEQKKTVNLSLGQKADLFDDGMNTSYITEKKPGFFSIELFMGGREERLYSEGHFADKGSIIIAIWTRDELIEIECVK